ncbi:MAG: (deoxy)nucleoside triphosphate pyrophosphohydrolase [Gemmatimonadota bacterium]
MREPVEIALGLVVRAGRILVQMRERDPGWGTVWEFPGGKIAPGEAREAAVAREVAEETGIKVRVGELLSAHCHAYPDRRVALYAYLCAPLASSGTPSAREPTRWRWVTPEECRRLDMPGANGPILMALEGSGE